MPQSSVRTLRKLDRAEKPLTPFLIPLYGIQGRPPTDTKWFVEEHAFSVA